MRQEPTDLDRTRGEPPPAPRWVKVAALLTGLVVLAVIAVLLLGGGDHGPGRHVGDDRPAAETDERPPDDAHRPPTGGHR